MAEKQKGKKIGNRKVKCGDYRARNGHGTTAKARRVLRVFTRVNEARRDKGMKPLKPEQVIPGWFIAQDGKTARPDPSRANMPKRRPRVRLARR